MDQKQNFHKIIVGGNLWYDYLQKMNYKLELNLNKNLTCFILFAVF